MQLGAVPFGRRRLGYVQQPADDAKDQDHSGDGSHVASIHLRAAFMISSAEVNDVDPSTA